MRVTNGNGPLSGFLTGTSGGEVWVTTDAGFSLMTNVTGNVNPNGYAISSVAMDSSVESGDAAYVAIMGFSVPPSYPTSHVWKTTNAGATWTDWTGPGTAMGFPDNPVNALLVDSQAGLIYAGTDVGVFVSSTAAPSWTEVGPTPGPGVSGFLPNAPVTALQLFNPDAGTKTLVVSTYGRGIWQYGLVTTPTFAMAVTANPTSAIVNQIVTWNGTLTALNGYTGSVALSCTSGAPGTCTITPATVTLPPTSGLSSPFTVTLESPTAGAFNFAIQGTDGTLTVATPETLTVGTDVVWTDTGSPSATVLPGQSATYTFSAAPVGAMTFSGAVNFGCGTLPVSTSCVFTPASIASGAGTTPVILTISTTGPNAAAQRRSRPPRSAELPPQRSHALAREAGMTSGHVSHGFLLNLQRQNKQSRSRSERSNIFATHQYARTLPLFALAWVFVAGIMVPGRNRYREPSLYLGIAVTCLGLGLMAEISCGGVSGSGGSATANFAIAMTQTPGSTPVNENLQWSGTVTASNGYSGTVALSCTPGAPTGCQFTPQTTTPTAAGIPFILTLSSAATGTFTFTISGTDGTLTNATPTETLSVTSQGSPPDFAVAVTATPNSTPVNQNVTWNGTLIALNPSSGTVGGVNLSCTVGTPATCEVIPPIQIPAAAGAPYTVTLSSTTPGTFNVTIQGTAGTLTHATPTQTLTVTPPGTAPDFTIAVTPTPNLTTVSRNITWNGTLTAVNGYNRSVALSCMPAAPATCLFTPQAVTPTAAGAPFTVTLGSATTNTFTFTISATDGTLTHATVPETLMVGDFSIALTPTPNSTPANQAVTWGGTVTALNGYIGNVTLNCGPGAPGICGILGAQPLTPLPAPGAAFAVMLGNTTAGVFNFQIQGTAGTLTHNTAAETLTVGTTSVGQFQITVSATAAGGTAHGDVVTLTVQ